MPTYDYRCVHCNASFQAKHSMHAGAPSCPDCGGLTRKVILSAPALHGDAARGREQAAGSLPECGKGCRCCP
jgi:putative FmdB family regulatory protein